MGVTQESAVVVDIYERFACHKENHIENQSMPYLGLLKLIIFEKNAWYLENATQNTLKGSVCQP